jgi:co-chaperonin GroES (HSP10)
MNLHEQVGVTLPIPKGYKVLIAVPSLERTSKGGIVLPEESMKREDMASVLGYVVAMGPTAYFGRDKNGDPKFPHGPHCRPGDWVALRSYTGTSFTVESLKDADLPNSWKISTFRLVNDDSIEAVVPKPEEVFKP